VKREIALIVCLSLVVAALASAGWSSAGRFGSGWSGSGWSGAGWFGGGRYSRVVDRTFDVTPDARLEIRSSSFDLSLVAGSGTTLHVHGTVRGSSRAEIDGVRVTMQQSGDRRIVAIEAPAGGFGFAHFLDAHFTVDVPRVAALAVVATSGDLGVTDAGAPLDLQTSSGDVTVDRARASVAIKTSSGDVIVRQAGGAVQTATNSGDVTVERVRAALMITTSAGDVIVRQPAGSVRTQTNSGDVHVNDLGGSLSSTSTSGDLTAALAATWSGSSLAMHSTSGDINLGVPTGFRGALHTSTNSGDVRNDAKLSSTLAGAIPIDLTSSSGDINVH